MFDIRAGLIAADLPNRPTSRFTQQPICASSGLAPSPDCPLSNWQSGVEKSLLPVCTWHKKIMVTRDSLYRVNDQCIGFGDATSVVWWILPPAMAYYYRTQHPEYRQPPPFSPDCPGNSRDYQLQIIYPEQGMKVITENEVSNSQKEGSLVAKAIHLLPEARIYWFLNGQLIKTTSGNHQVLISPMKGQNKLSIHDDWGNISAITFWAN